MSGVSYTYDPENRMSYFSSVSNGSATYGYDSQNKRIWNWTGSTDQYGNASGYTIYYYGVKGERLGVYNFVVGYYAGGTAPTLEDSPTSTETYFGGRRLAPLDRLGSARTVNGSTASYYPFGEDKSTNLTGDAWRFGTYWGDSISGLDYAVNRFYSSQLARFMTPDSFTNSAAPGHPGTWNRYAYVAGDPVNFGDPSGMDLTAEQCIENVQACDGSTGSYGFDSGFGSGAPGSISNPDWNPLGGIFIWAPLPIPDPFQSASEAPQPTSSVAYVPRPTYLLDVGDCYYNGNGITRRRDYEVLDQNFQPITYSVTIDEQISNVSASSNTIGAGGVWNTYSSDYPGDDFYDFYSNGGNSSPTNALQTYWDVVNSVDFLKLIVLEPSNYSGIWSTYNRYGTQGVYYTGKGVKIDGYYLNAIIGTQKCPGPPYMF